MFVQLGGEVCRERAARTFQCRRRVVKQMTGDEAAGACSAYLVWYLLRRKRGRSTIGHAVCGEPWPDVAIQDILAEPPVVQRGEALLRRGDRPVELRGEVIDPAGAEPFARVGVNGRVRVETIHAWGIARAPDAERRDAELHHGLDCVHLAVESLDERIDVRAPPVRARERAAVPRICRVIRKRNGAARGWIRIEVVV